MSEVDTIASGNPVDSSGTSVDSVQPKKDSVQYETYQKVLSEAKRAKAEREELASKLKSYEQKELEAQGKHQELLESLRAEVKTKDEKLSKVVQNFAMKTVETQIIAEAQKHGCLDTDALLKLIDTKSLEVNSDNFTVNSDDLKREMEKVVKERSYLFKNSGPRINDMVPSNTTPTAKSLNEMDKSEIINLWKNAKV